MSAREKKTIFRKPDCFLWTGTVLVMIYAVWCVLVLSVTLSGHLLSSQRFGCGHTDELVSRLKREAGLVYLWSGLNLVYCIVLLLKCWKRDCWHIYMLGVVIIPIVMIITFYNVHTEETQEIQNFKRLYLELVPLRDTPGITKKQSFCNLVTNVNSWQTEFKCCGLESYQDWNYSIPNSCLCDGEADHSACVGVGKNLVYEKPCLPIVLSHMEKRSSAFRTVMIIWLTINSFPCALFMVFVVCSFFFSIAFFFDLYCAETLSDWKYKLCGGVEMVPVVFIRKDNNNQIRVKNAEFGDEEESGRSDGVVLDIDDGTNVEGEGGEAVEEEEDDNPVRMIPLSELKRLQNELNPPPVQYKVQDEPCMCLIHSRKTMNFYKVLIEEDSPLLPSDAVLVDADKPTRKCFWVKRDCYFDVKNVVWPKDKLYVTNMEEGRTHLNSFAI